MPTHYSNLIALVLTWLCIFHASHCNAEDIKSILTDPRNDWASTTTISFPGTQQFINATLRWEVYAPPTYSAAISPGTEADVVKSVKLATAHNIPFLATGARHGYTTTFARLQNGLAIDLSKLNSIVVNVKDETVTVGGGVRIGQVFDPVYNAGFELQTGTSQCPGMVGATLGAGVGRDEGRYGLVIDALQSVRLVTADSRLIEVSATSNAELFWAIRGAGANFGVITSATFKLHKIADNKDYDGHATSFDMMFPANMSAAYFNTIVETFNNGLPAKLSSQNLIAYDATANNAYIIANWIYFGSEAEGRKIIAPILDLKPTNLEVKVLPWNKITSTYMYGADQSNCPGNRTVDIYGINMRAMSASTYQAAFEKTAQFYKDHVNGRKAVLTLEFLPNKAAREVADDATAYPWRDTVAQLLIVLFEAGDAGDKLGRELRSSFAATSGYPELSVYVSYAHGDETPEQIYGKTHLPKLAALKKAWDPNHVFSFNNPLPTKYP